MPNQEYQLLSLAERLERHRDQRHAVQIHLSRLSPSNRRGNQIKIAGIVFERAVLASEGQLFALASGDLVFVYRVNAASREDGGLADGLAALQNLFAEDPLMRAADAAAGATSPLFVTHYDLERDYHPFLSAVKSLHEEAKESARPQTGGAALRQPIHPHRLGELVDAITSADLSNFMRRQPVFQIAPQRAPEIVFRELFISIMDLRDLLTPEFDITSNRWLFQYLTESLDRRMLALMSKNDDPIIARSFSINLNVSTLLSPEFLAFDALLRQSVRRTIIIELQMIDIYADLPSFIFARNFLHRCGYRLCLDSVTPSMAPFVERQKLGLDLVKLQCTPDFLGEVAADPARWQRLVEELGPDRTVLCHVDSDEAIRLGQSIGIALYQGRLFDRAAPRGEAGAWAGKA